MYNLHVMNSRSYPQMKEVKHFEKIMAEYKKNSANSPYFSFYFHLFTNLM